MGLHINEIHCDTANNLDYYNEYYISEHSEQPDYEACKEVFPCGLCGKCFTTEERLIIHMKFHTEDKSFNCKICSNIFLEMAELIIHTKNHRTDKKPIKYRAIRRRGAKRRQATMKYI